MNKKIYLLTINLLIIALISLYLPSKVHAWLQIYEVTQYSDYGFWVGLWHGLIAPFAFIAQIFDNQIVLYSSVNNGFVYNLGFLLGISMIIGGGTKKTCG